jgi:hypothetical protein
MCGAMGAVAGQVVSVSGGWAGGPSAGWLRAQRGGLAALLFRPEGYHDDVAAATAGRYFEGRIDNPRVVRGRHAVPPASQHHLPHVAWYV